MPALICASVESMCQSREKTSKRITLRNDERDNEDRQAVRDRLLTHAAAQISEGDSANDEE
jgi:hypothetical protein